MASSSQLNSKPKSSEKPVVKNITYVKQMKNTTGHYYGEILSVSRDSKHQLIVGKFKKNTMYIYGTVEDSLVKELHLPADNTDLLKDVTWTPNGHIVYTTVADTSVSKFSSVVTLSPNGDVIALTNMANAQQLSVSTKNVTYLADKTKGIYQSSDGGLTWSFMFNLPKKSAEDSVFSSKWSIVRALEVSADQNFVHFWALLENGLELKRLQMYKIRSNDNAYEIIETVSITITAQRFVNMNFMEFDGLATILVSCYFSGHVYLFDAVSGAYLRTVDSIAQTYVGIEIKDYPERMAIDRHTDGQVLLYIAHAHTAVSVYTVSYK